MKRFLLPLFIALLVLCLGAVIGFDGYITYKCRHLNASPFGSWNDIFQKELNSDLLVIGSSRAYAQFDPHVLDSALGMNCYNLGCNGRQVESQLLKYKVYREKQNSKPKIILYELSPNSFNPDKGYEKFQYLPYLHNRTIWKETHQREGFSWADLLIPCWRYRPYKAELNRITKGESYYCRSELTLNKGFFGYNKHWDSAKFDSTAKISYFNNPTVIQEFKAFLEECQQDSIKVIFVLSPYYIGATQNIRDLEGMHALFEEIAAPYNIPILDYTHQPISYDTSYFYNYSHLNRTGAKLFSAQLAKDLLKLRTEN